MGKKYLAALKFTLFVCNFIVLSFISQIWAEEQVNVKPISTGPVRVVGRQLQVDFDRDGIYQPFFIKGLGYQPTPVNKEPDSDHWTSIIYQDANIYNRDLAYLRDMNANAIRTWATLYYPTLPTKDTRPFFNACYNNGTDPIYIAAGFWIDPVWNPVTGQPDQDLTDTRVKDHYRNVFATYVQTYKDHPALLLWAIGNENNIAYNGPGGAKAWFDLAEDLASTAYAYEGANYHPVSIGNGGLSHIEEYDALLPNVDMWGINYYEYDADPSFGSFFENYANLSSKPMWLTEYGIDAYSNKTGIQRPIQWFNGSDLNSYSQANRKLSPGGKAGNEDQATQALWNTALAQDLMRHNDINSGGTIFEYSDEWWKAGSKWKQDLGGYNNGHFPDGYMNEEWFGVVAIQDNGSSPDKIVPRQAYTDLTDTFLPFILNLEVAFHLAENANYDGAASAQMTLDYLSTAAVPSQTQLQDYGRSHNDPSNSSLPYIDAKGIHATMENYAPVGYEFEIGSSTDQLQAMAGLCYWITFDLNYKGLDPRFVPGLVPTKGTYQRWMVVQGVSTELDPQLAHNYTINGVRVSDPDVQGIGGNKYISGNEWLKTYFRPLVSNDNLNGKYAYVVEPPGTSDAKVAVRQTEIVNVGHSRSDDAIKRACQVGLEKNVAPFDPTVAAYLEKTEPSDVLEVKSLQDDYYLVSFRAKNQGDLEIQATGVLMVAKLADGDLNIQEVSTVEEPVEYLPVSEAEALEIVRQNVRSFQGASSVQLVADKLSSPFAPTWKIIESNTGDVYFVDQDGNFSRQDGK